MGHNGWWTQYITGVGVYLEQWKCSTEKKSSVAVRLGQGGLVLFCYSSKSFSDAVSWVVQHLKVIGIMNTELTHLLFSHWKSAVFWQIFEEFCIIRSRTKTQESSRLQVDFWDSLQPFDTSSLKIHRSTVKFQKSLNRENFKYVSFALFIVSIFLNQTL